MNFKIFISQLLVFSLLGQNLVFAADEVRNVDLDSNVYTQESLDKEEAPKVLSSKISVSSASPTKKETRDATELNFDGSMPEFKETQAGRNYFSKHGAGPKIRTMWGHPVRENRHYKLRREKIKKDMEAKAQAAKKAAEKKLKKSAPKVIPQTQKKSSLIRWLMGLIISEAAAAAYEEDVNFNTNGLVNCRDSSSAVQGYFKAYFEEVSEHLGVGYADPQKGLNRRIAACEVLKEIADLLLITYSTTKPEILFAVYPSDLPTNALGAATAYYGVLESASKVDNGTLYHHIINRTDPDPVLFDAEVYTNFNSVVQWSVDSLTVPQLNANNYDFKTMLRHEFMHALGFMSLVPSSMSYNGMELLHNSFAENIYATNSILDSNRYFSFIPNIMGPTYNMPNGNPSPWFVNNTSVYQGKINTPNATAGGIRPIYSPSEWQQGSSISHFDMNRPEANSQTYVMHPALGKNISRDIHLHEKEVLCHLGYAVESVCPLPTPIAIDDILTMNGAEMCVPFINNDVAFTGNINRTLYDVQQISPTSGINIVYYYQSDCNPGTELTSPNGATAFKLINPNQVAVTMKYRIRDISSNRISQPALIYLSSCSTDPSEHVCNGSFEMGLIPGVLNGQYGMSAFSFNAVPYWGANGPGTPDLILKNQYGISNNFLSLPWISFPSYPSAEQLNVDMVNANSKFASFILKSLETSNEMSTTKLKTNLIAGEFYNLKFDINLVKTPYGNPPWSYTQDLPDGMTTQELRVGFSTLNLNTSIQPSIPYTSAEVVFSQNISIQRLMPQAQWQTVSYTFQATQNFEHLVIYMPPEVNYQLVGMGAFIDNVSIKKAASNSVAGTVFNDINANGIRDPGETGVGGAQIGAFNSPTATTPVATAISSSLPQNMGEYKFTSLPPLSSGDYYIAVLQENTYPAFTLPQANSLLSGHQRALQVPISIGEHLNNKNFGVLMAGQIRPISLTSIPNNGCAENQGSINLSISGGTPPFTISWLKQGGGYSSSVEDPANLSNGTYIATVTDSSQPQQTASHSATIIYAPIVITGTVTHIPAAAGTGQISTTVTGTPGLTYAWTGPNNYSSTQQNATGLSAPGTYNLTVTNSVGCTSTAQFNVRKIFYVTLLAKQNCVEGQTPITSGVTGGQPPFTYVWSNSAGVIPNETNYYYVASSPGTYSVAVTEVATGFTNSAATTNVLPYVSTVINGTVTHVTGTNNGAINASATGLNPLTYSWTKNSVAYPGTTPNLSNLGVGSYNLTVKNGVNCIKVKTFVVGTPMSVSLAKTEGCTATANSITATVSGGTAPYTYQWTKDGAAYSSTVPNPTGLSPGVYSLTVIATGGQVAGPVSITINNYPALSATHSVIPASAPNYNNGSITTTVTGGLAPYTFHGTGASATSLSGPIQSGVNVRSGITGSTSTYSVYAKDARGCSSNTISNIKVFKQLTATSSVVASCLTNPALPRLVISPVGGHSPYTYVWAGLTNTANALTGGAPMTHSVTVKDSVNQIFVINADMPSAAPGLQMVNTSVTGTTSGLNNGSVFVSVTGALAPLTYVYAPGVTYTNLSSTTHTQGSLANGNYTVTVKTNLGCNVTKAFSVMSQATAIDLKQ